ncbi:MAG: GNAT family N-acetyltransferase [Candidatus Wildermuthbacteria bacterium]|nr:GNAT family N-acetyltransferase [Candidatus Wildermuthbacteria bacterium]
MRFKKIKIRNAKPRDIKKIIELEKILANYHHRLDPLYYRSGTQLSLVEIERYLRRQLKKNNVVMLVAKKDNEVIGYFEGQINKRDPLLIPQRTGYLSSAVIKHRYRKLGLGRMMFERMEEWMKRRKIEYLELTVNSNNKKGIRTWKNLRFREFMKGMRKPML